MEASRTFCVRVESFMCSHMHVVLHFIAMKLVECYCIVTHCIRRNACWVMGRHPWCCHCVASRSVTRKALFREKKTLELFVSDMLVLVTLRANWSTAFSFILWVCLTEALC
jgi:hypothetical protein